MQFDAQDMGLDLYFIIDHSGSVEDEWVSLSLGLAEVFKLGVSHPGDEPAEFAGIGVGFGLYPTTPIPQSCIDACASAPQNCDCLRACDCEYCRCNPFSVCECREWPTSCDDDEYQPTVTITPLSDGKHKQELEQLTPPRGLPALRPALLASLRIREEWESAHPRRRITQVLVGASPLEDWACDSDSSEIEEVLGGANTPKTYVVAVNRSSDTDYDRLALAGRTEFVRRIRISSGGPPSPPPTEVLPELVRSIREAEGRCEYLVPNGTVAYDNLNLAAKSSGALFPRVPDSAACARNPQGWYYDPPLPGRPTRMIACDGACKTLHGPTGREKATVSIQVGCPTVLDAGP
jgi:hypothetical protein